jgi:hypothetical protein
MVFHIKPIPYLLPIAADGQGFASQCAVDRQRNEFFGELKEALIIRAVGGQDRQAVRVIIGAHEVADSSSSREP